MRIRGTGPGGVVWTYPVDGLGFWKILRIWLSSDEGVVDLYYILRYRYGKSN